MKTEHVTEKYLSEIIESAGKVQIADQKYSLVLTWSQKDNLAAEFKKMLGKAYMDGLNKRGTNSI